jgi:hypothetical protein
LLIFRSWKIRYIWKYDGDDFIFQIMIVFRNRKMIANRKKPPLGLWDMVREFDDVRRLGPLILSVEEQNPRVGRPPFGIDATVNAKWGDLDYSFVAELKARSTPQAFNAAVRAVTERVTAKQQAGPGNTYRGMIVLPYLREDSLEELAERQLSGIDLSGNGIVVIPGELYVYCSGQRNRYPDSPPTKYAYRGATALVPRVFLCRPEYNQVSEIRAEIQKRGATITLSTVSKALKRLELDALITRRDDTIRLLQPDTLLDKLRDSYQPPRVAARRTLALPGTLEAFFATLPSDGSAMLSGASSVARYAVMGRADRPVIYCRDTTDVDPWWKSTARETDRFADVELCATNEDWVFLDARRAGDVVYASPVQAYLELATGEQRERQVAEQIRERILAEVGQWTPS